MKILVVCTTDSMIWNFLIPHIKYWQSQGDQIELACSRTGFYFDELEQKGLTIHEIPFARQPFNVNNLKAYQLLKDLIRQNNYDCVISQEPVGGVVGRMAGKANKTRNIYTAHGFHFYNGAPIKYWMIFYPIEKFFAKYTDVLVTINNEDYERAKKFTAKSVQKINGIGVDLNKFGERTTESKGIIREKLGIEDNCFVILTVAELIHRKNYETALRAVSKCNIKNFQYLICGDGELKTKLNALAKKLGISERVRFLGFRKDVSEIYHAADVFLFPTYQEGLSIALIEAMACGIPILCSDIRGNRDLIVSNKGGLLFSPNDADGFSNGLEYYAENDSAAFVEFNLEQVKKYSIEKSVNSFYEIITGVKKGSELWIG